MKEEIVTFETAKLAKEKGFIEVSSYPLWFHKNGEEAGIFEDLWNVKKSEYLEHECIIRSTQALLQKWIREIHNLDIIVSSNLIGYGYLIYQRYPPKNIINNIPFQTYEEALERGLQESLQLIK